MDTQHWHPGKKKKKEMEGWPRVITADRKARAYREQILNHYLKHKEDFS